jgi:hypothetical protein
MRVEGGEEESEGERRRAKESEGERRRAKESEGERRRAKEKLMEMRTTNGEPSYLFSSSLCKAKKDHVLSVKRRGMKNDEQR